MRKGATLERNLNKLLKYLETQGIHGHKNNAYRLTDGTITSGEPFDYEIFAPHCTHCFDAKECAGNSWNLKTNAKLSQVNALKMCKNCGAKAYFLVYFVPTGKVIRFDVDIVINALKNGKKSLNPQEGEEWKWQELLN